mmetsp:Transcript_25349/g.81712  ORF Transcript_25349/g.81712 Transcript_25349/m.81712 type:complete len:302 (-) Transcript_25349:55-960(-)
MVMRHRDSLTMVQTMITVVLGLGLLDAASRYFEFVDMNKTGTRSTTVFVMALVFRASKRTLSRAVVLMVALGYGISKPSLGSDFFKILGLSFVYIIAMVWSELIQAFVRQDSIPASEFLLLFVIANLDVLFYFWIFRAIVTTSLVLERQRQHVKMQMYGYFRNVMIASVVASVVWALYYTYSAASGSLDRDWEGQWVFDAFWETLYLVILVAIMILWRPSENSLRYAYMQQLPTSEAGAQETFRDDDDEGYLGNVEREEEDVEVALAAQEERETQRLPQGDHVEMSHLTSAHTDFSDDEEF